MRLSKYTDVVLITILAFAFISRGNLGVLNDILTWFIAAYYFIFDRRILPTVNKPIFISFFLLLIYLTFNILFRESENYQIFYYFTVLIPYYFVFRNPDRGYLFILLSGMMCALVSIFIILHQIGIISNPELFYARDGSVRASGFMYNPNYFAYMNFVIFILVFLTPLKKHLKFIILALIFLAVVLSFSRGVTAGLTIFLFMSLFKREWLKYIFIAPLFVIIIIIIFNKFLFNLLDIETIKHTIEYRVSNLKSGDLSGRSTIWIYGFKIWFNDILHILFGFGFGNFQNYIGYYGIENTVHNSYLRSLYELGLVGTVVLIYFYKSLIKSIKSISDINKFIIISSILVCWFSNDFFINKDTFLLLSLLALMSNFDSNSFQNKRRLV